MRELGDCRGNLQTALKNDFLPLKANILRPLHEPGEVSGGLDVLTYRFRRSGMVKPRKKAILTDAKVLGGGIKQRVLDDLGLALREGSWGWLLTGLAFCGLVIESKLVE
jgi:hypothetical protein